MKNVYTIVADAPFSLTLARWLIGQYGNNPETLSRIWVLLPSHRAIEALRAAFLKVTDGMPLILPRMQALGDIDEEDFTLIGNSGELPPPPDFTSRRLFIVTRLIQSFRLQTTGEEERIDHALRLARELAGLLDEAEREQVSLDNIAQLVPEEFAEHWQLTVDFLRIFSEHWPDIAKQEGLVSPIAYRNQSLQALAKIWRMAPPDHPVIAAGSTGSIPATAALLSVIATLPEGAVILPGYNIAADEEYMLHITPSHPQWGMQQLLHTIECSPKEIRIIGNNSFSPRSQLASEIMRPAETVQAWQTLELNMPKATQGMTLIECTQSEEEAATVTLLLREALETPAKTAALVTHDRSLARRVAAHMRRYGIKMNDSAGTPLAQTPAAVFLRLILEVMESRAGAVSLLSLLKHPFTYAGPERIACLEAARALEILALRRPQSYQGLEGLQALLRYDDSAKSDTVKQFIDTLYQALNPLERIYETADALPFTEILSMHLECAQTIAGEMLWQGPEAEVLSELITEWQSASSNTAARLTLAPSSYASFCDAVMDGHVVRSLYGTHPRIAILSPIEARMQMFDRVILGGLNEGSWPQDNVIDPWFNRSMRSTVGLPAPQVAVGRAAHDWVGLFHSPELFMTRARKVQGMPATPSRWLEKLQVLVEKYESETDIKTSAILDWVKALHAVETTTPCLPPAPTPPLSARPRRLSVTEIETWMRDPYSIYARHILRLRPLPSLEQELTHVDFGSTIHTVLERWLRTIPGKLPLNAKERLLQFGREALQPLFFGPQVEALWWPRFIRIMEWLLAQEEERRSISTASFAEVEGTYGIGNFTLTGRADRVDQLYDGSLIIIDYKTGTPPSEGDVRKGLSSQLPLLALIASEGTSQVQGEAESLEYWHLIGTRIAGKILRPIPASEINNHIELARKGLQHLVDLYNNPEFPYWFTPVATRGKRVNDYAHLARVQEWS